jgi:hypothetical protein
MGLLRGVARTAAIAGTATAVSNRVSRRQAGRWAAQDQQAAEEQEQAEAASQPPPPPPAPAATSQSDMLDQLQKLGELKSAGVLTEEEFATQKARILAG